MCRRITASILWSRISLFSRDLNEDFFESGFVPMLPQNVPCDVDWSPACNDPATAKEYDSTAHPLNFAHVVRRIQNACAKASLKLQQDLSHLEGHQRVKIDRGFMEQQ